VDNTYCLEGDVQKSLSEGATGLVNRVSSQTSAGGNSYNSMGADPGTNKSTFLPEIIATEKTLQSYQGSVPGELTFLSHGHNPSSPIFSSLIFYQ
jgi:hypothetical protein